MGFIFYLKTLKPEDWSKKATDKWTVKDVVAHLVGWEKEVVNTLDEARKTGEPAWFMKQKNWDEFNKQNTEFYKNYSPKELLEEWEMWQEKLEAKIKELGESELRDDKDMEYLFDEGDDSHYEHHYRQIKKAVEEKQ